MPLYDFQCKGCGHEFEVLVRAQDPAATCPSCKSEDVEKLPSSFAVSSAEKTATAAKDARKRQIHANRDRVVAEEEYRKEHEGH